MSDVTQEDRTSGARRGSALVFLVLVLLTLAVSALLVAGFWGDTEEANDLTPLQADIGDVETGPGSPVPD